MISYDNNACELNENCALSTSKPLDISIEIDLLAEKKRFNDLIITRNKPTNVPFLSEEIRAQVDAEKFAVSASLMLNTHHIRINVIVKDLLRKMFIGIIDDGEKLLLTVDSVFEELLVSNTDEEGDYIQFAKTINGFAHGTEGTMTTDSSWLIAMASLSWLEHRLVGITTTLHPVNMGPSHSSVKLLAIVLAPIKEKTIKRDIETSRNIAAILSDLNFQIIVKANDVTEEIFRNAFKETAKNLQNSGRKTDQPEQSNEEHVGLHDDANFGKGIYKDLLGRLPHYLSDYKDAFNDKISIFKTIQTIFVLFFANLLPTIAFGMLNESSTNSNINVPSGLISQLIGGVIYAIFSGQPLIVMLTTSPLSIMIMVYYNISSSMGFNFFAFYAWIGIFNTIYLLLFAFTGFSRIMKFSRRSTEETFVLFVSITFVVDAIKACLKSFDSYYFGKACLNNITISTQSTCLKQESLLFILLLLGTMALGLWLDGLTQTPFLNSISRRMLAEFALPVSVLFMSFVGSYVFKEVKIHSFNAPSWKNTTLNISKLQSLPVSGIFLAGAVAIPLSILFFMEQNIASSIVNSPLNKLKKGAAYNWDLVVVGIINLILSFFGLPLVHGALPHSPMHVAALATIDEHVDEGNKITQKIVKVVETRIPSLIANILIGCCLFLMPYPLLYIPAPVLNGLFLYMAFAGLQSNQLFERLLLFITEQSAYPPNHYLKRVPQKKVHIFTVIQALQLVILCVLGFFPIYYVKMAFPIILILQLPFRHVIFPKIIAKKYLDALDKLIL